MGGSGLGSVKDAGDSLEDLGDFAIENTNSGAVNVTDKDGQGDLGFTFWIEGEYLDEDGDGALNLEEFKKIAKSDPKFLSSIGPFRA
jgi:hypothetical protein